MRRVYLVVFFFYLLAPLAVMALATFNTSRFPTVTPWLGPTTQWFVAPWHDRPLLPGPPPPLLVAFFFW